VDGLNAAARFDADREVNAAIAACSVEDVFFARGTGDCTRRPRPVQTKHTNAQRMLYIVGDVGMSI